MIKCCAFKVRLQVLKWNEVLYCPLDTCGAEKGCNQDISNLSPFKGIAGDKFQTVCGSFSPYIHIPQALRNMLYLYKNSV